VATSGTVGQTTFDTTSVIEHAFRRVKQPLTQQTPDTITLAKQNLYLLLMNLANRGLNLWAVEKQYIGCVTGQSVYQCPVGTIDLLNLVYSQPSRTTGTDGTTATSITTQLSGATTILRIGVKVSAVTASDTLTLSHSADGVTWSVISATTKTDWAAGTMYWFDVDPQVNNVYFKAEFGTAATFAEFYLASALYDLPLSPWSRDTWAVINNKTQQGRPSTSYFFEKLIRPQVTVWPVPNNSYDYLTMYIHRQIQDVGTMMQSLEIPSRWYEAVVWQLAERLAFELPNVDAALAQMCVQMAEKYTLEVEDEESDGMPFYIGPNLAGYSA
jgi:hypothetical protein